MESRVGANLQSPFALTSEMFPVDYVWNDREE